LLEVPRDLDVSGLGQDSIAVERNPLARFPNLLYADGGLSALATGIEEISFLETSHLLDSEKK
jgi:hypothetical protein